MYSVVNEINLTRAMSVNMYTMCINEINLTRMMCVNEVNQTRRLFFNEINLTRMMFESRIKQLEQKVIENTTDLSVANQKIDLLQSFCITNGLEIPFWNSAYPPSADVSSMEALSASTAVACANFVLEEEKDGVVPMDVDEADASEAGASEAGASEEYEDIMNSIKDFGDAYSGSYGHAYGGYYGTNNLDYIPVPHYASEAGASEEDASEEDASEYEESGDDYYESEEEEDESAYDL
jgi:hypothetical protein